MPGKRLQSNLNRKLQFYVCTDTLVLILLHTGQGLECMWTLVVISKADWLGCCFEDMKISELSQVAQHNGDMIACRVILYAHSFCIVFSVHPCHEKPSKTQSSIHLQESQKPSATL